jgi:hypothetical protein
MHDIRVHALRPIRMSRAGLSSLCVVLTSLMAAVHLLGFAQATTVLSGVFLAVFVVLEWPLLIWAARGIVLTALGLFGLFWSLGRTTPDLLAAAVDRAAFFVCFVVVLSVLGDAAGTSKIVRTSGRIIVNQTPGRRYLTLSLGGHLMGVLMNLGTVTLLSTMIHGSVTHGAQTVDQRIRDIRLRRMTLAMLRGFSAVVFWAPTSVTIAIILSSSLQLRWVEILPIGIPALILYIALGWVVDRLTYPRPKVRAIAPASEPWLRPFAGLLGLTFLVPLSATLVSYLLGLSLIGGLFLCVPVIGMGWIFLQYLRAGAGHAAVLTLRRARTRTVPSLRDLRNELTIFAASGFLAVILLPQIDVVWLSENITRLRLGEGVVLVAGSWVIILSALLAVNPLVTAPLVIETLVRLPGLNFEPVIIAFMVTTTWGIIVGFSPFAASVRLTARGVHCPASEIGPRWNFVFSLCAAALLDLALLTLF